MASPRKYDPTGTTRIRQQYVADVGARFDLLERAIRRKIVDEKFFGGHSPVANADPFPKPGYQFPLDMSGDRIDDFMTWLGREEAKGGLSPTPGVTGAKTTGLSGNWQNRYVDSTYRKGVVDGYIQMKRAAKDAKLTPDSPAMKAIRQYPSADNFMNTSMAMPVAVRKLQILHQRQFTELKGITDDMGRRISSVLTSGVMEGRSPVELAVRIARETGVSRVRARMMARTEVIRAHAEAKLDTFEALGAEGVTTDVEWSTAGDAKVCDACESGSETSDGEPRVFSLAEARGILPLHPNCRCSWIPSLRPLEGEQAQPSEPALEETAAPLEYPFPAADVEDGGANWVMGAIEREDVIQEVTQAVARDDTGYAQMLKRRQEIEKEIDAKAPAGYNSFQRRTDIIERQDMDSKYQALRHQHEKDRKIIEDQEDKAASAIRAAVTSNPNMLGKGLVVGGVDRVFDIPDYLKKVKASTHIIGQIVSTRIAPSMTGEIRVTFGMAQSRDTAHAMLQESTVNATAANTVDEFLHEQGHILEYNSPILHRAKRFLWYRVQQNPSVAIQAVPITRNGKTELEYYFEDKFLDRYTGRIYNPDGASMTAGDLNYWTMSSGTEITSMWFTEMYKTPSSALGFYLKDQESFEFGLRCLRGDWKGVDAILEKMRAKFIKANPKFPMANLPPSIKGSTP